MDSIATENTQNEYLDGRFLRLKSLNHYNLTHQLEMIKLTILSPLIFGSRKAVDNYVTL